MLNGCDSGGRKVAIIADRHVADLHLQKLTPWLPPECVLLTFPPGEKSKSHAQALSLYHGLATAQIERGDMVITFGGGVAGDLGGFVAATWLRGIAYIQVATSLLAAVDAAVGGKTAVNLPEGKNLVGVFHQPQAVVIDTDFLETLPQREFLSGLAESVKHAVIRDPDFFAWHEQHAAALVNRDGDAISTLIERNCEIKADVVAHDERETGVRVILNHGHTIGHALEHLLKYELRHGECVALGMLVENELASRRGLLSRADADRIRALLSRLGLLQRLPHSVEPQAVASLCGVDKKVVGGAVNLVLIRGLGQPERVSDVTPAEIVQAIPSIQ
jgi:3-dehydroquinate synthase